MTHCKRRIAYFSMEVGLASDMPTYSGGLGVLAGDTIRSAADLGVPMVAVTLLHRKGYFHQILDGDGTQREDPAAWIVEDFLQPLDVTVSVSIEGRSVLLRPWKYEVNGIKDFSVPVYFLDANRPENSQGDRELTDVLYGGDARYRICQEVILGIGGLRMLRALGYNAITRFHMNEGHSSLLTLELLYEHMRRFGRSSVANADIAAVKKQCVFTTHTPVPAGHDQFSMDLVGSVLGDRMRLLAPELCCHQSQFNMTYVALSLSHYINGVAKRHSRISQRMFRRHRIDSITNGVHAIRWVSDPFQEVFDRHIPGWREDNGDLRSALTIPRPVVWGAHRRAKEALIKRVNMQMNEGMDADRFTLGFARRATAYKRSDLLFEDTERLKAIVSQYGAIQVIFAGKAHPNDQDGKQLIKRIYQFSKSLRPDIHIVYLANYDIEMGKLITSGVDVWLNTPQPPMEASGTSGMKAALNGVPSLSILDGWWAEGCLEGVTGWAIGNPLKGSEETIERAEYASSLYDKLEKTILPIFYQDQNEFIDVMRHAIALNGSFFNTNRMVREYVLKAYS